MESGFPPSHTSLHSRLAMASIHSDLCAPAINKDFPTAEVRDSSCAPWPCHCHPLLLGGWSASYNSKPRSEPIAPHTKETCRSPLTSNAALTCLPVPHIPNVRLSMEPRATLALHQSAPVAAWCSVWTGAAHPQTHVCVHTVGEHCYFKPSHLTGVTSLLLLLIQLAQTTWVHPDLPSVPPQMQLYPRHSSPHSLDTASHVPSLLYPHSLTFDPEGCQDRYLTCEFS